MPRVDNPDLIMTAIRVTKVTRDKLNTLKLVPSETMESVIERLIDSFATGYRHLNVAQRAEIGLKLLEEEEKKANERIKKLKMV